MNRYRVYVGHAERLKGFEPEATTAFAPGDVALARHDAHMKQLKGCRDACKYPRVGDRWACTMSSTAGGKRITQEVVAEVIRLVPKAERSASATVVMRLGEGADASLITLRRPGQWQAWCNLSTRHGGVIGAKATAVAPAETADA